MLNKLHEYETREFSGDMQEICWLIDNYVEKSKLYEGTPRETRRNMIVKIEKLAKKNKNNYLVCYHNNQIVGAMVWQYTDAIYNRLHAFCALMYAGGSTIESVYAIISMAQTWEQIVREEGRVDHLIAGTNPFYEGTTVIDIFEKHCGWNKIRFMGWKMLNDTAI